ncbi:MAG: protein translocase subunit SecD [Candidatus Pacebacteria bacterium]|nr:protein translocase subunit SecD [Candidatus Paceibacterota bacterium]MCF7862529.1 protein translocase subunit SecD [Candidatus Paceibacterota bacterium]
MWKNRILAVLILLLGIGVSFFVFKTEPRLNTNFENESTFFKDFPFRLGLDLSGGSHLVYKADVSAVPAGEVSDSMNALRDVIERRVNLFGVSEPIVQVQRGGFVEDGEEKLIVDLPGVTDVEKATKMIGETPLLEFRVQKPEGEPQTYTVNEKGELAVSLNDQFVATDLTGRYLKKATVQFDSTTRNPVVGLEFDDVGKKLFADITEKNIGKPVAIYLDGSPISIPTVNDVIREGVATISGDFTPDEAKVLVGRLNSGALPVPITLVSRQTIGATLGENAVQAGAKSAMFGFGLVALFLILWYRLPGVLAFFALSIYVMIILFLFKLIPVTLTSAGIAGFIISIGIAVDANILIFERMKEEMRSGKSIKEAMTAGFDRAWLSIRDSNISSLITSVILFWFGTSLIKGFALTLGMGVLVSMFSAIVITRLFLLGMSFMGEGKVVRFLFGSGFSK